MRDVLRSGALLVLAAATVCLVGGGTGPAAAGSSVEATPSAVGPAATRAWADLCATRSSTARRVFVAPGASLEKLTRARPAGTVFCIRKGVHRLRSAIVPRSKQVFVGEPGAVLSGAKGITARFVRSGRLWVASGQWQRNPNATGRCQPSAATCVHPNDVFLDGKLLRRVPKQAQLRRGSFYFDHDANRIWIATDPRGRRVEAAVVTRAIRGWGSGAANVVVRGLVIEMFANEASSGAVQASDGWIIDANEIRQNHGIGLQGGDVVTRNRIHHNGQLGFATHGATGTLFAHNEVSYNNAADYDWFWEAGGTKFMITTNLVVRSNYVHHNRGAGLATDWDNIGTVYEANRVEDNLGVGIFHEASYDAVIRNNVVRRNGHATRGGFDGAGIGLNSSQNVEIVGNTIEGNLHGVGIVTSTRVNGKYGAHGTKNVHIHDNTISVGQPIGASGLASDDHADYTTNNNRFQANRYTYCQTRAFAWQRPNGTGYAYVTKDEWIAAGNDTTGSFQLRTSC